MSVNEKNAFAGGGEMGALIRAKDWSRTPIGDVESWSPTLKMMVRFLLANRFPLLLWWGKNYISIYNDAYRPVLGEKHPWALGTPVSECWSEIWHVLKPLIDTPFQGGPSTWHEDIVLEINRHGFLEETHFTVAYSPVPDDTAPSGIGGVLATVNEITEKVVAERRVVVLRDVGTRTGEANTAEQACAVAARMLEMHAKDVPFALFYTLDEDAAQARFAAAAGVPNLSELAASVDSRDSEASGWPFADVVRTQEMQVVQDLAQRFASVPPGPWSDPPTLAVVMSIPSNKPNVPAGLMVLGVSARLALDAHYRDFFELLRTQVAAAIGNARALDEERKRAEALAQLDRAKTTFFSNVSHELRTPLTLVLGPLEDELAETEAPLSGERRARFELARRNALRLQKLVNTLLDFARIEAGRSQASYVPTDLGQLTAELASVFRSAIDKAGLRLVVECQSSAERAYVDRDMWEKVVLNLLSNAFKFTLEGEVRVRLAQLGDHFELVVADTGVGIRTDQLPHVFDRFHRVKNERARTHEGSGIGLSLVRELVRLHGGDVAVVSEEGRGTTFRVSIPAGSAHLPPANIGVEPTADAKPLLAEPFLEEALRWLPQERRSDELPESGHMAIARPAPSDGGSRPRVLLVDDNADMREYLSSLLRSSYQVETASDGRAALESIRAAPPDLVVTDVMMPHFDGFGLVAALRADERTRTLPVIMLSARAGEEARVEGLSAGVNDYVTKPFSARELLARIGAQLEIARLRAEAEAAIRRGSAQLEALLNQAPLGVCLVDADFRIRIVNPVALPVVSDIPGGVVGRPFDDIMRLIWEPRYADEVIGHFRHTLETGEPVYMPERAEFRADRGVTEYYEWRLDRITLPDGRYGLVCYFRDISAQVLARKAVEDSAAALREADRSKDEFLATLAHELRNPLAPLRTCVELLRLEGSDATARTRMHGVMERQLGHMVRLVDDLLEISRITRGKVELRKEPLELTAIVKSAVETARPLIDAARHELVIDLPAEPLIMSGDPVRLSQVLSNLLNNAAKYTPGAGKIWLSVRREGSDVLISVRDSGVGIPAAVLPRVFDLFMQANQGVGRTHGGLGIGLTLVRTFVALHGGSVEARSNGPGQGSEFIVRLRLSKAPVVPAISDSQPPASSVARRRILVVDDNHDAADTLGVLLGLLGVEARVVHDGPAALDAFRSYEPAVVLLDLGLPGMDGFEIARRMRSEPNGPRATLIALTGWGQEDDRRRSKRAGIDMHLVKPVDLPTLRDALAASERTL